MQSRVCSVVDPTVWNSLPPALRLLPRTLSDTFYNQVTNYTNKLNLTEKLLSYFSMIWLIVTSKNYVYS